jgi:hypothetical protein
MATHMLSPVQDHPTSHLMQSVPGYHNRSEFEIYCYSLAPDDGSSYRKKIATEVGQRSGGRWWRVVLDVALSLVSCLLSLLSAASHLILRWNTLSTLAA